MGVKVWVRRCGCEGVCVWYVGVLVVCGCGCECECMDKDDVVCSVS